MSVRSQDRYMSCCRRHYVLCENVYENVYSACCRTLLFQFAVVVAAFSMSDVSGSSQHQAVRLITTTKKARALHTRNPGSSQHEAVRRTYSS